jgi:hypothetical protein
MKAAFSSCLVNDNKFIIVSAVAIKYADEVIATQRRSRTYGLKNFCWYWVSKFILFPLACPDWELAKDFNAVAEIGEWWLTVRLKAGTELAFRPPGTEVEFTTKCSLLLPKLNF